jgi:hypothetical protein
VVRKSVVEINHVVILKKKFASLRLCVSFLLRDHANLLCIFKRLFNARSQGPGQQNRKFNYT